MPLDGIWLDDEWFYGGSEQSVHYRTVLAHPLAVMHLTDRMRVVIVEGAVRQANLPRERAQRLADASNTKYAEYGYAAASAYANALCLTPSRVIAWMSYPTDATRFRFD